MLRIMLSLTCLLYLTANTLAATEEDRRTCASEHNADLKITACTRVIEDHTSPPAIRTMAYRDRGLAYANKNLQELAIADFDEVLKIDSKDTAALGNRGRAYQARGQYDRAIADFSTLIGLLPGSERAYNERGLAHLHKGELAPALADFEKAIAINATFIAARNNRGVVLAREGKPDVAIIEYSEALRLDPEFVLAYANRGRAYEQRGEFEQALLTTSGLWITKVARPRTISARRATPSNVLHAFPHSLPKVRQPPTALLSQSVGSPS